MQEPGTTPTDATSSEPLPKPPTTGTEKSVGELVLDVTETTSSLVREEIELAKAEIGEKAGKIMRGSVVGIVAGVFAFLALILVMEGVAWLLNEELFDGKAWPGFFVEAAIFLLIAAGAGYFAYRSVQAGSPPIPEGAIDEAKRTRTILEGEDRPFEAEEQATSEGSK